MDLPDFITRDARLMGKRVMVQRDVPKMQLSPGDYVTPEFRKEVDLWLLDFFGTHNLMTDGQVYHDRIHDVLHMNPRTFYQLKYVATGDPHVR
jgi:hypothetical protein